MDHSRAPVLDALAAFRHRGDVVYGPPGHRQGRGVDSRTLTILGEGVFSSDVLMLNGLDDRRQSEGVLEDAQSLMADAVGAEHAFFSTCGSSLSVKSAMLAVAGPGEKLLISRNAHKSVISGVIVNGTVPIWVHPKFDAGRHLAHPPEPADVRRALEAHPDAKGMLLITPTDWGSCADVRGVAAVCHEFDVPLIVDEAWGAHLPFHDQLPAWGMNADADLVVTSVHKMGGAIEQSSVFHLQGGRVDPTVLKQREDLLGTTSASSLVYASLDGWRRHMVEHGHELMARTIGLAQDARSRLGALDGISVMGAEVVDEGYAHETDPLVLTIDVRGLGITGYQAAELARTRHHVDFGAADSFRLNARLTHADDQTSVDVLVSTVEALRVDARGLGPSGSVDLPDQHGLELETAMRPRDAFFAAAEQVDASEAVGRVAAELVTPYPPGVPVLTPGEVITAQAVEYLQTGVKAGMLIAESADTTMGSFRVVASDAVRS
ncbi:aminotransferase class I/II-fold pyridoxal phosphate-dependent enzyme [Nocardioides sp. URHA0020]|uniref:aminotransferase class I/II-fold pyridoxal phosphate-dependent enzyme n=1 Tax=Nocardioides sp. URHA0020 TaxID=1380392 RepID=UPI00048B0EC8|nr:ornithine decarboxylase [Nocardioides sp. URHA0020]